MLCAQIEQTLPPGTETHQWFLVDETYIRVKGEAYLYRAVDSTGATIDFVLSAHPHAVAAKRFFQTALVLLVTRVPGSSTWMATRRTPRSSQN